MLIWFNIIENYLKEYFQLHECSTFKCLSWHTMCHKNYREYNYILLGNSKYHELSFICLKVLMSSIPAIFLKSQRSTWECSISTPSPSNVHPFQVPPSRPLHRLGRGWWRQTPGQIDLTCIVQMVYGIIIEILQKCLKNNTQIRSTK